MAKAKSKKLPPPVEEARKEERRADESKDRCSNCGHEGTLTTRVSCTSCGATLPA